MNLKRIAMTALLLAAIPAAAGTFKPAPKNGIPNTYLVLLREGVAGKPGGPKALPEVAEVARSLARAHDADLLAVWEHALHGFLARMPEARARKLADDPRVAAVEQDFSVLSATTGNCYTGTPTLDTRTPPSPTGSPQTITCADPDPASEEVALCTDNWGLDRADQTFTDGRFYFSRNGTDVYAYILDSGIHASHREFKDASSNSRVTGGVDTRSGVAQCAGSGGDISDALGHGTHVAGIIGGLTFGVAKNVRLVPVHSVDVAGPTQSEILSATVAGIDWIRGNIAGTGPCAPAGAKRSAVVNWSGGNDSYFMNSSGLHTAVGNLVNSGVILVQSVGNHEGNYFESDGRFAYDAADFAWGEKYPDVIVVGGMDHNKERWAIDGCFTARECGSIAGSSIDLWAPAKWIVSASRAANANDNAKMCHLSGTSMAAPHVTGAVAAYLDENPDAEVTEVVRALRGNGHWGWLKTDQSSKTIGPDSDNVVVRLDTIATPSNRAPDASVTVDCPGKTCSFTAVADDDGPLEYAWRFGDGTTGSGSQVLHTYASNFNGYALLEVTDTSGRTDHVRAKITLGADPPPTASFPPPTCQGTTCTFTSTSTDNGSITAVSWNFGDNTTGTGSPITHTFPSIGTYSVTLTVTDNAYQTASTTRSVTVTLNAPTGVTAVANGTTVNVSWTAVAGADSYDLHLKSSSSPYELRKTVTCNPSCQTTDTPTTSSNGVVLYQVVARAGASSSPASAPDVAYVGTFTDLVVTPQQTIVRAVHITEIRAVVNGLRRLVAGQPDAYTATEVAPASLLGQVVDDWQWTSLMTNLSNARLGVQLPAWNWTNNDPPAADEVIVALQIKDLRDGVK